MIRVSEIVFERSDCCALHASATVTLPDGREVGLLRGELGFYSLAIYQGGGLVKRLGGLTAEQVEAELAS